MLEWMTTLLPWVGLLGFDPPRVRLSGQSGRSSDVDSCRFLGVERLDFLAVSTRQWYLVSDASGRFKSSTVAVAVLGRWFQGGTYTKTFRLSFLKCRNCSLAECYSLRMPSTSSDARCCWCGSADRVDVSFPSCSRNERKTYTTITSTRWVGLAASQVRRPDSRPVKWERSMG